MVYQKHDKLSAAVTDMEPFADLVGEYLGTIDVLPYILSPSGVVKEDGQVERVGVFYIDEKMSVALCRRIVGLYEGVELIDAAQGVLIGSVTVKKLVLDEAFQGAEFREVAAKDPAAMHKPEGACDLPFLFQDCPEGAAVFLVVVEALVDPVPVGLDELTQGRGGAEMVFLAVQKEAEESGGLFFKYIFVLSGEAAFLGNESIKLPDPGLSSERNPGTTAERAEDRALDFRDFEHAGSVLVNIPCV